MNKTCFRKPISLLFLLLLQLPLQAQINAKWYFGQYAGLDFTTNPPTVLNNGKLNTSEGCASISSNQGDLLFYTDGTTVYDVNHNVMPGGTGLMGHNSAVQSAVICPKPGTYDGILHRYETYFIITCDASDSPWVGGINGVRYTEVDMTANNGLGAINTSAKNVLLFGTKTLESIVIASHANTCDFWIVTHEVNNNIFRSYLIDENGINPPVASPIGPSMPTWPGSMKVSPDNKLISIVSRHSQSGGTHVLKFNNTTGSVTGLLFSDNVLHGYHAEFSPNSSVLYVSNLNNSLYQYNLAAPSIVASKSIVGSSAYQISQLQTAPNGKMYAALNPATSLGVINNPDNVGTSCDFVDQAQNVGGTNLNGTAMKSNFGLPLFPNMKPNVSCESDLAVFENELHKPALEIPNVFTPDGDGINDVFELKAHGLASLEMQLFDRWGNPLFKLEDPYDSWNGLSEGKEVENGAYFYVYTAKSVDGKTFSGNGFVHVIRK